MCVRFFRPSPSPLTNRFSLSICNQFYFFFSHLIYLLLVYTSLYFRSNSYENEWRKATAVSIVEIAAHCTVRRICDLFSISLFYDLHQNSMRPPWTTVFWVYGNFLRVKFTSFQRWPMHRSTSRTQPGRPVLVCLVSTLKREKDQHNRYRKIQYS